MAAETEQNGKSQAPEQQEVTAEKVSADVVSDDSEKASEEGSVDAEPVVTVKTWIVTCILSAGYGLSFYPIPVMAAIGGLVSTELGDPTGYIWFISAWIISITCAFLVFGPATDLLGRRWFLVGGNLICTAGHIIVATAKDSNQVVAGLAISGFGAANSQMAAFAVPELLPNKWRHIGVVIADFTVYIAVIAGPVTARFGYEMGNWEWNFWALAICQFLSFLGLVFLYFPPAHPHGLSFVEALKSLDYLGAILFTGGAVPLLMGIVWAGVYPSKDPHVVGTLTVGCGVLVLFGFWESSKYPKYPLTPPYVFTSSKGRDFTAPAIALGVVNMFYYSSSLIWPTMTMVFYTNGGADWKYATILSLPQGCAITLGALLLTAFGSKIRHWHWQLTGSVVVMVVFGSLMALVTPTNKGMMIAFLFLSQTGFGWAIYLSIAITQMGVEHKNLGVSGGISGCFRFAAGAIATTIYTTVFNNSLADWTLKLIPSAAIGAGLAESRVADLLSAMKSSPATLGELFTADVVLAASAAQQQVYCKAIFMVSMVSLAFGILGIIACACCKDVDHKMNNKIETYLENTALAKRNKYH